MSQKFKNGEKVYATYHHTWNVDKPMLAKILFKSKRQRFHLFAPSNTGKGGLCDWYWILCKGNIFPSLFPETCLEDVKEYAERTEMFMKQREHKIGEKGYSYEAYNSLLRSVKAAKNY